MFLALYLWSPQAGTIHWALLYALLGLQELLLIGLPAIFLYLRTDESRAHLFAQWRLPASVPVGLTSLAAVSFTLASLVVAGLWVGVLQRIGLQVPLEVDAIVPRGGAELAVSLLAAALLPALCEELMFRGILFNWVERKWGARSAVLATSCLFAALHFNLMGFASFLLIGLLLASLRRKHGGIVLPILFHAVYNAVVLLMNTMGVNPSPQAVMLCVGVFIAVSSVLLRKERLTQ